MCLDAGDAPMKDTCLDDGDRWGGPGEGILIRHDGSVVGGAAGSGRYDGAVVVLVCAVDKQRLPDGAEGRAGARWWEQTLHGLLGPKGKVAGVGGGRTPVVEATTLRLGKPVASLFDE